MTPRHLQIVFKSHQKREIKKKEEKKEDIFLLFLSVCVFEKHPQIELLTLQLTIKPLDNRAQTRTDYSTIKPLLVQSNLCSLEDEAVRLYSAASVDTL